MNEKYEAENPEPCAQCQFQPKSEFWLKCPACGEPMKVRADRYDVDPAKRRDRWA